MSLTAGTLIGPYRIVEAIGAGGMGEVYRATDTRLGRDVAIKVLPDSFAADANRRARFEREAQALASLNHFNIAQIYGLEDHALVMELLEGETLRDRLKAGPLPLRKAIEYAGQIARGLAAAHDRGIIHRDLKPENIFVINDGQIKILDFGLARREAEAGYAAETVTGNPVTDPGVVMGTVGYMSPEQVRGLPVDARSDLFSLGAVLYEMLTGQRAFRRDSAPETMSAILNDHPADLSSVRAGVSAALDRIVNHCLEKNPVERFQSARDVAFAFDSLSGTESAAAAGPRTGARSLPVERLIWAATTMLLMAALGWLLLRQRDVAAPVPGPPARGLIVLPEGIIVNDIAPPGGRLTVSPDGSRVLIQGRSLVSGLAQLFLQPLDGSPATPLPNTQNVFGQFWSPDSRQILMFTTEGVLERMGLDGSAPVVVVPAAIGGLSGGAMNINGEVLVGGNALRRLRISDRSVEALIEEPGYRYGYPAFLSDGQRFLFGRLDPDGKSSFHVGRLGSKDTRQLLADDATKVAYANGALVFARGDTVFAQRADGQTLQVSGEPVTLANSIEVLPTRGAAFSLSSNGVLVYQATESRPLFRLTWLDRQGHVLGTIGDDGDYSNVELSRDGRRLLVSSTEGRSPARDIFMIDVNRGVRQRFTSDASDERSAVWSPDDRSVVYTSKGLDLYKRNADSSGGESVVLKDGISKDPYDWSPDGRYILYRRTGASTGNDLWLAPADGTGAGRALLASRFSELSGNFSPDGRRIVYSSDQSGTTEVYVVDIDGGGQTQISANGGVFPRWSANGKEIFYLTNDRMLMSAAVGAGPAFEVAAARPLFRMNMVIRPGPVYDVTPNGERFIVAVPVQPRVPASVTVLTNWPQLLPPK